MSKEADRAMDKILAKFRESGLTLMQLGKGMGYGAESARQGAWQFLGSKDPRIGTLRRACEALGMDIREVVS